MSENIGFYRRSSSSPLRPLPLNNFSNRKEREEMRFSTADS